MSISDGLFTVLCNCGNSFPAETHLCNVCSSTKGELKLDIEKMFNKVYNLNEAGQIDNAIDVIFDVYYNLFNRFDIMNDIAGQVDVSKLATSVLLFFLTQTFKYSVQVPNHLILCNKVETKLRENGESEERIDKLLKGFRETGNYWKNMEMLGAPEWLSGPKPKD